MDTSDKKMPDTDSKIFEHYYETELDDMQIEKLLNYFGVDEGPVVMRVLKTLTERASHYYPQPDRGISSAIDSLHLPCSYIPGHHVAPLSTT